MALTLANDPNVLDANPVQYSRALQTAASGHVLWHPSDIERDGGIIGDCGYFDGGRFQVLFNVFDPPHELDMPALPHPTGRELRVEELPNYNTILQSSQSHTVSVEASLESPPLPNLPVLKVELAAHAAVSDQTIAFLAFCGPRRRTDWYAKTNAMVKYLVRYEDKILQYFGDYPIRSGNVVIVHGSTRAVSWWGGISHSHSASVSGRAGIADGAGVSVEVDNTHNWPWIFSRGPEIWEEDCDLNRSLILRVVSIKRRPSILRATRKVLTTISDFAGAGFRREGSRNASTTPLGDSAAGVSSDLGARDNQADGGRELLADHSERLSEILGLTDLGGADNGLDEQDEDEDLDNSLLADQPDLLSEILDLVLNTYPDIDVAVGSWETIAESLKLLSAASGDDVVEPIITRFREGTDVVAQLLNLQLRASTPRTNPRSTTSYASPTTGDYTKSVPPTSTDGHATSGGLLQIDTTQAASSALKKSAQTANSLFQQCSQLRERLMRVHDFQPYLTLASQARFRHSTDPVDHLWGCLALGVPLCFLFNLLPGSPRIEINADPKDIDADDREARQRATTAFVININQLQKATGDWEEDVGFEIEDLIDDERNTTGFAKVVRTVTALVDRLPQHVFMHDIPPIPPSALESPGGIGPGTSPIQSESRSRSHSRSRSRSNSRTPAPGSPPPQSALSRTGTLGRKWMSSFASAAPPTDPAQFSPRRSDSMAVLHAAAPTTKSVPTAAAANSLTHGTPFARGAYVPPRPSGAPEFRRDRTWDKEFEYDSDAQDTVPVALVGRGPATAPVLSTAVASKIRPHLPPLSRLASSWTLLYSLDQHGISLSTLYKRCALPADEETSRQALVVVRDADDGIFGAFVGEGVVQRRGYYGSGESFLWRTTTDGGGVQVYRWTGKNTYVALCEPGFVSFGGGDGHFGLWLDAALFDGSSARCPTFDNDVLCGAPHPKSHAEQATARREASDFFEFEPEAKEEEEPRVVTNKFECVGLEVWWIGS